MRLRPMHPMVIEVVQAALQVCDRTEFFARGVCHSCGGALSGYDTRTKRFALVSDDNGDHPVEVILHRAYCRECGKIWMPEEPFYAGTRIGSPVVDLCQTLAMSLYSGHVAEVLDRMGVKVDRWSVRSYSNLPIAPPPTVAVFGMNIPLSIVALSSLNGDGGKDGPVTGADILDACNHPSQNRPYL